MSRRKKTFTKKQFSSRWKAVNCWAGKEGGYECWCREIWTEDGRSLVMGSGQLARYEAEYFVKLHNERIGDR